MAVTDLSPGRLALAMSSPSLLQPTFFSIQMSLEIFVPKKSNLTWKVQKSEELNGDFKT